MYTVSIDWTRNLEVDFAYEKFNRNHTVIFSGGQKITNSAALEYFGDQSASNPEELLAAALGTCHMLTFLAVAAKSTFVVESYQCISTALMGKNAEGKFSVTEINLTPTIVFSADKEPTKEQLASLHDKAHRNCFIAQSIRPKVTIL